MKHNKYMPIGIIMCVFNLLQPIGYVMHHQFNIQQLYDLPTCVLN